MDLFKTTTEMVKKHDEVLLTKGGAAADDYLGNFLRSLNNDTLLQIMRDEPCENK